MRGHGGVPRLLPQSALSEYGRQVQFWTERYKQLEASGLAPAASPGRGPSPLAEQPSPGGGRAAGDAAARIQALQQHATEQETQVGRLGARPQPEGCELSCSASLGA